MLKSIERSVTDALKREKESDKSFHCDDTAQIKSEICGILKSQNFNIKKSLQQL